jgi:hypothetical protein
MLTVTTDSNNYGGATEIFAGSSHSRGARLMLRIKNSSQPAYNLECSPAEAREIAAMLVAVAAEADSNRQLKG